MTLTTNIDIGIVTALKVELESVLTQLDSYSKLSHNQSDLRTYYHGKLHDHYQVVVTQLPRMGNIEAALATSDMINLWKPRNILMVGIAAGVDSKKQNFGDVVVSESIYYYDQFKIATDGIKLRPRMIPADTLLYNNAINFHSKDWPSLIPASILEKIKSFPRVFYGPIASGEKIIANEEAVKTLKEMHSKFKAIEMESYGVASAAFSAVINTGFMAIRGISDFADSKKDSSWHEIAANAAAAWMSAFLSSKPIAISINKEHINSLQKNEKKNLDNKIILFEDIKKRFDMDEFKTLCFLLDVDIDELPGDRKSGKVRELIRFFERRGQLEKITQTLTIMD